MKITTEQKTVITVEVQPPFFARVGNGYFYVASDSEAVVCDWTGSKTLPPDARISTAQISTLENATIITREEFEDVRAKVVAEIQRVERLASLPVDMEGDAMQD